MEYDCMTPFAISRVCNPAESGERSHPPVRQALPGPTFVANYNQNEDQGSRCYKNVAESTYYGNESEPLPTGLAPVCKCRQLHYFPKHIAEGDERQIMTQQPQPLWRP